MRSLAFVLFLGCSSVFARQNEFRFQHIGREQGLTTTSVTSILQDTQGFMWFGTRGGLFRYDGQSMKVFKNDRRDSTSIGASYILSLFEDADGDLWAGTSSGGLNRFDREHEAFLRYSHNPERETNLNSNIVSALFEAKNKKLWIGTGKGLNWIDPRDGKPSRHVQGPFDTSNAPRMWMHSICEDRDGAIWAGAENGVWRFDLSSGRFEHFLPELGAVPLVSSRNKTLVLLDRSGTLWVGTSLGLYRFDRSSQAFVQTEFRDRIQALLQDRSGNSWLATSRGLRVQENDATGSPIFYRPGIEIGDVLRVFVERIYEDRTGALWFGSNNGVYRFDEGQQRFSSLTHTSEDSISLSHNRTNSIRTGPSGALWVVNFGAGGMAIDRIDPLTKEVTRPKNPDLSKALRELDGIADAAEARAGHVWLAAGVGLVKYDPESEELSVVRTVDDDRSGFKFGGLETIHEDRSGRLWVANHQAGPTRILQYIQEKNAFTSFELAPGLGIAGAPRNGIAQISEGRSGRLSFASKGGGVFVLPADSSAFTQFTHNLRDPNSLGFNWVRIVHEDQDGIIWAAPFEAGLNRIDPETGRVKIYTTADGLPDNDITNIVEDDRGRLWLTTSHALTRFDPRNETFKTFGVDDGLVNDSFRSWHSAARAETGDVFFGGPNGIDYVHPDSIRDNPHVPAIVFTGFSRFNSSDSSGNIIVEKGVSVADRFDLSHDDHTLNFTFAALNYRIPYRNQYAYKLDGLHDDWLPLGNRREVTLTNLDPGEYTLRVKGSNNDGVWNEQGAAIVLSVSPPWWQTKIAYGAYVLFAGIVLFGARRFERRRAQLRQTLERKEFEAQKLKEVDELKSRFFADISHEFRTPLTLILGPLQNLITTETRGDKRGELSLIKRNAKRLQTLIEQLLDLSKIEARRMVLRAQPRDIVSHVRAWTASFVSFAKSRNITLHMQVPTTPITVYFDPAKLEKAVNNLLANAFSFTPEGGQIHVEVTVENGRQAGESGAGFVDARFDEPESPDSVLIRVSDSGVGISADHIEHVFNRFYRVSDVKSGEQRGTGIGLALAKEVVQLHSGTIDVQSELDKGSSFTVTIPLGRAHLSDAEVFEPGSGEDGADTIHVKDDSAAGETGSVKNAAAGDIDKKKPVVLIVEDNADMRHFLSQTLSPEYEICEAENGETGLALARRRTFDLVVSDVMMPVMDGISFCRALKTDSQTSHLPVILLTARAGKEDRLTGLETGADDYLTKPFDARELRIRVKNLLDQRQMLRTSFRRQFVVHPQELNVTSMDEAFLRRAIEIVEAHITESEFRTDQFSSEIGMSRSSLNRKLRALTGLAANGFIRSMRLKRARQLLQAKNATVVEIAYQVGFNNPSYFAECFRAEFGHPPSEVSPRTDNTQGSDTMETD